MVKLGKIRVKGTAAVRVRRTIHTKSCDVSLRLFGILRKFPTI